MSFIVPLLPAIFATAATAGTAKLLSGGGGQQQVPQIATRNDALERAAAADNLARRTGARGQKKTPVGGAEASTGPKTSLLGRTA